MEWYVFSDLVTYINLRYILFIVIGFETAIAPLWKRFVAEMIDTFLFSFVLKYFVPEFEYR